MNTLFIPYSIKLYSFSVRNSSRLPVKTPVIMPAGWFKVWRWTERRIGSAWRSGIFCVEQGKLLWRAGEKERPEFSLWPPDLPDCKLLRKDTGTGLNNLPVLQIHCLARHDSETVLFSGPEEVLSFWLNTLQSLQGDELESCPNCGAPGIRPAAAGLRLRQVRVAER